MKVLKSKKFIFFVIICIIASALLILFNLSQVKRYQIKKRNTERVNEIGSITKGVKNYIENNNNLPTTSNPDKNSFLPELILVNNEPRGGISVHSLENIQGYFDVNIKDPSGNPYFVGSAEDKLIIYTSDFELEDGSKDVYFRSLIIKSLPSGKVVAEEVQQ